MAVAGLHNVSPFGPFPNESQRRESERNRPNTRASSLLRMWREMEGDGTPSPSYSPSQASNPECVSAGQETGTNGRCNISEDSNNTDDDSNSVVSERSSDLGENERGRVRRIFREWKNSSSALAGSSNGSNDFSGPRSDDVSEADSQVEHVRDGLVINDRRENIVRRSIRKLCGRQTLVDLLTRAQCERKGELQLLSEQKPVSEFSHRNRIQALLRGRFLRSERPIEEDKRQSSVAANELDFLRQRQTVSDLREEFLSKLDRTASSSSTNAESDSSSSQENNSESTSPSIERQIDSENITTSDSIQVERYGTQENEQEDTFANSMDRQVAEIENQSHQNVDMEPLPEELADQVPVTVESVSSSRDEQVSDDEASGRERFVDSVELAVHSIDSQAHQQYTEVEVQDSSLQLPTEWATDYRSEAEEERDFGNRWFQETSETNNSAALNHYDGDDHVQEPQEEDWPSRDFQEAIDSWLLVPSSSVSLVRFRYDYFPDDENAQTTEISELSSQRRVSSLLRSSFRDSLDQVLQSHVERQVQLFSSTDSEGDYPPPVLIRQGDEEQLNADQSPANQFDDPTLNNATDSSDPLWDGESLLPPSFNHLLGMEWEEVISGMRIDMARLQQRMNTMQSMLEACVDMQIELQRCVRQELSAALNRTVRTKEEEIGNNESRCWEDVRRGVCCICGESNINSLLYRCGHMCTCGECALGLVRGGGKCPMCRAPIVEAVRAYFTQ